MEKEGEQMYRSRRVTGEKSKINKVTATKNGGKGELSWLLSWGCFDLIGVHSFISSRVNYFSLIHHPLPTQPSTVLRSCLY